MNEGYWEYLEQLLRTSRVVIDRPKGSSHPRYAGKIYPVDYGYLDPTTSLDGGGIDVWAGSLGEQPLQGMLCTVDLLKRDAEIKLVLGCLPEELLAIQDFINSLSMRAIWIGRESV